GRNHVERIKLHLTKRCAVRLSTTLITDAFRPILKSDTTKQFQGAAGLVGVQHRYAILQDRTREALKLLHPGVEVPSTEQLSTVFLGRAFNRSIKIVTVTLSGKVVTLVTDCWADINGKDVVNYCAVCGIYTFFLESAYTGTQLHDAAFLTADVERIIAKYDFLDVGAVVTDNTSSNQATWKALQEKFHKPFFHGCVCHGLHLLVKDIVKKIKWMDDLQSGCKILHGLAYLLDPPYGGINMDNCVRAYHHHVRELKASQPRHWMLLCEQKIPVFDFWCGMNTFPLLQEISLQLLRYRVEKLEHIYFNAKNICDEDIERYSHLEDLLREAGEEEDVDEGNGGNESEDFVYY
ncbi:hypothetical protein JG688_00018149, partial [Phytophthora aleatoria]